MVFCRGNNCLEYRQAPCFVVCYLGPLQMAILCAKKWVNRPVMQRNTTRWFRFGWLLGLLSWITLGYAEDMRFESLFTDTGAERYNIGAIWTIEQDSQGFIWLGGDNGLARYDGVTLKHYRADLRNPKALPINYVWDLQLDKTGVLWVATDAGLVRYNSDTDDFTRWTAGRPPAEAKAMVRSLACDTDNNLYLAGAQGLQRLSADRQQMIGLHDGETAPDGKKLAANDIQQLYLDADNNLWVATVFTGAVRYHLPSQTLTQFKPDPANPQALGCLHVQAVVRGAKGQIWMGTGGCGIERLNRDGLTFTHYRAGDRSGLTSNRVTNAYLDSQQRLWFTTDQGGLLRYDEPSDTFIRFVHSAYDRSSLSSDKLRVMFEDRQGDFWVGAFPAGVNYHNHAAELFTNYAHRPDDSKSISHSSVISLLEDSQGIIWVGTEGGINQFDPVTHEFSQPRNLPAALASRAITRLAEDRDHNVWISVWGLGLFKYERSSQQFRQFSPDPNNPHSISSQFIWSIVQDSDGQIWLGTDRNGLDRLDPHTEKFTHFTHDPKRVNSLGHNRIASIDEDKNGDIWVATLNQLDRFNRKNQSFEHFDLQAQGRQNSASLRQRVVRHDSLGRIWVGTQDDGVFVYNPAVQSFTHLTEEDGLPANNVASILEDNAHDIWLTTDNGVARLNGATFNAQVFQKNQGLPGNNFNRDATLRAKSGLLYFGGTDGLSVFDPSKITASANNFPVLITELRIFNEAVTPQNHPELLSKAITQTVSMELPYRLNMLAFSFAALNFGKTKYNSYAYKLEGFDENWAQVPAQQAASYTNLNPGHYVFRVKAANADGSWSAQEAALTLDILPPPWLTFWAFLGYVVVFALGIFWVVKSVWRHAELNTQKALNVQLRNLDQIKDAFLANTSHELRTPLSGMVGLAQSLLDDAQPYLPAVMMQRLNLMVFSGKRLLTLINDILDFSKNKDHRLTLVYTPVNLYNAAEEAILLLRPLAENKAITLINTISKNLPTLEVDANRLQQILINLIGNGIKFTNRGAVTVSATQQGDSLVLWVKDTGIGIASTHLATIFQPFEQLDTQPPHAQRGTGLGLSVSQQLAELHGGTLRAESELHKGSTFILTLPLCQASTADVQPAASPVPIVPAHALPRAPYAPRVLASIPPAAARPVPPTPVPPPVEIPLRILIVDDDPVNRLVLSGLLKSQPYSLAEANSGQAALDYVAQHPVDLIILDVMMPGMTGYETCEKLRKQYPIEDLPIIFLTANRVDDEVMKGFNAGGNEFLTKPVSKAELLPRVANHLHLLKVYRQLKNHG